MKVWLYWVIHGYTGSLEAVLCACFYIFSALSIELVVNCVESKCDCSADTYFLLHSYRKHKA